MSLIAQHGIDGVSVRDIASAAGQKNAAAIGYHFGSKEQLVREILIDCAKQIDDRRNAALDDLEAAGGPNTIREIVDALIDPSIGFSKDDERECQNRFVLMTNMTHSSLFSDAVEDGLNSGYQRCLAHLRRLMPQMPPSKMNERFIFMGAYLGAVLSAREARLEDNSREHRMWGRGKTLDHFADTVCALLERPYEP